MAETGTWFVVLALVGPIVLALAASGMGNRAFLNLVHVSFGAIWAGATVYVAGVYGPALLGLDPQTRGAVSAPVIPRNIVLFVGVGVAALVTGPMMAVQRGLWDFGDPYFAAAMVLGVALLLGAGYLVVLQLAMYREMTSPGPPDGARMGALAGKVGTISPVMLVLQLAILVDMTLFASF